MFDIKQEERFKNIFEKIDANFRFTTMLLPFTKDLLTIETKYFVTQTTNYLSAT